MTTALRTAARRRLTGGRAFWREISVIAWLAPGLAMMFLLFLTPIAAIFRDGFFDPVFTLDNFALLANDPLYRRVMWNSIYSATLATVVCLLIGYPTAYAIFTAPSRWRHIALGALLFSFAVGTVPRTFSWLVILGDQGLINTLYFLLAGPSRSIELLYNRIGVVVGMVHVMLPYIVLILFGSMSRVSPRLVPAARTLGAKPWRAFVEIFLPLTMPGVIAGAMLIFVYSLGFYLVPAVLGGARQTTVVMQIESLTLRSGIWGLGAALSSVVIVVSVLGAAVYVWITNLSDVSQRE